MRIKQGKGQPIREDGPASHLVTKKGTPTMGGLMILSGLVAATLLWANLRNAYVWIVLFVTVSFGLIGFYDDYLKVTKQSHAGFSGKMRLALEFLIAGLACYALMETGGENMTKLAIPMVRGYVATLGPLFILFGAFVIVAAGNCVNLTDGLDGLAIVPSMIAAGAFAIFAYLVGNSIFSNYLGVNYVAGVGELTIVCSALHRRGARLSVVQRAAGANLHGRHRLAGARRAARRRRGGGEAGVRARHRRRPVRASKARRSSSRSVYFKLTGKRIFLMAPIHHHFEQKGWKEPQIVIRFWIIAFVLALMGLSTLKLR